MPILGPEQEVIRLAKQATIYQRENEEFLEKINAIKSVDQLLMQLVELVRESFYTNYGYNANIFCNFNLFGWDVAHWAAHLDRPFRDRSCGADHGEERDQLEQKLKARLRELYNETADFDLLVRPLVDIQPDYPLVEYRVYNVQLSLSVPLP